MDGTISSHYDHWCDGTRKVARGVHLMSQIGRIYAFDLVHFLHLAVGGSLLFIRSGGISYYKRGRFREIGPSVTVAVASQCAQYVQKVRGALLCIGDNGDGCTTELDMCNCVDDVYAKVGRKFRIGSELHCLDLRGK